MKALGSHLKFQDFNGCLGHNEIARTEAMGAKRSTVLAPKSAINSPLQLYAERG
jgi:hypothetical protein